MFSFATAIRCIDLQTLSTEQARQLRRFALGADNASETYANGLRQMQEHLTSRLAELEKDCSHALHSDLARLPVYRAEMVVRRECFWDAAETLLPEAQFVALQAQVAK